MKRLFQVADVAGLPVYYYWKREAKKAREILREAGHVRHVRRGPDHWRGETVGS